MYLSDPMNEPFIEQFSAMQRKAYTINVGNGWWEDRNQLMETAPKSLQSAQEVQIILATLGLAATEISEAIEAVRKHHKSTWSDASTKDTLVRELAGTVVRLMDIAERWNLPLAEALIEELKHNSERGYRHGGKAA